MKAVTNHEAAKATKTSLNSLLHRHLPWVLLSPILLHLLIFRYIPTLYAFFYSFTDWDGIRIRRFLGLRNFTDLFSDYVFLEGLKNMAIYTSIRVILILSFAFIAAEMVISFKNANIRTFWKIVFVIPMIVPLAVNYLLWGFILSPQGGMLNSLLEVIGLAEMARPWLGTSATALLSITFIQFPFVSGLAFLVFVSALEGIPADVIDACKVEGCGRLRRIIAVDFPMLRGSMIFVGVLVTLQGIQTVEPQLILTKGGPGIATESPGWFVYRAAFQYGEFGLAAAAGVVMVLVGLVFSFYVVRARYKGAYDVGQ
ncbi:MAG: sugar ABC transporter permease [OCS116 cluster bacterium]|uniref:ABC transmembrane type-1 domain-containing protein n=1 Tax=OCS116 cluster bacterium TaxID=2030921 RepID=A0A2A4YU68_9PROT|nr:sugar ABC transporter permease [OCS116 cluster bacterium]